MGEFFETITRGNVAEVKIVLASIVTALALYQVFLMTVGYGKLRLGFLRPAPASSTHRAVGDAIVVVTVTVALMCLTYFEFGEAGAHAVFAIALLTVLVLKIVVVRWWHAAGRFLPLLGISVLTLFIATWISSAADYLLD
jgi:Family of unknown function (DUF6529)